MLPITLLPKQNDSGFTLVEMLLVVVIIGVLASVAVPRYSRSFEFMKLRSGAYDVAATVEYAKAMSALEERTLRFRIENGGAVCVVFEEDAPADRKPFAEVTCRLPDGITVRNIDFTDVLAIGRSYIEFRPDGECEPCAMRIGGRSDEEFRVEVPKGAGSIRVVPNNGT